MGCVLSERHSKKSGRIWTENRSEVGLKGPKAEAFTSYFISISNSGEIVRDFYSLYVSHIGK